MSLCLKDAIHLIHAIQAFMSLSLKDAIHVIQAFMSLSLKDPITQII